MKISSIKIQNFKTLQNIQINELPSLAVFVGANGTGKTTLFDVFGFLKDCLTLNVTKAVQARGGYTELISRGHIDENIIIEIKYEMKIAQKSRLVTYYLEIGMMNTKIAVKREYLCYKRSSYGSPYHFLDFANGNGFAISNEEDFSKPDTELAREDQNLGAQDILAIKGLGQFEKFKAANEFRKLIEGWHVSDFHIESARGSKDITNYSEHLLADGSNLQNIAHTMREQYPQVFQKVLQKMKERVPGVDNIQSESTLDGRLLLKFQSDYFKDPFIDRYVSDGTLKMFAYLILLHDPSPHPLLCIEEPENQLYPKLLYELVEELRDYARTGGQVFLSTHSPELLNAAYIDEVFWLAKEQGFTRIQRASEDRQICAYMNEGDKLGYLWKQGFFTGADPQ
ncbi:AAA family ATPase [Treponema sp. HNW]|uniref:AAA family ATPase n=1 Tax=Treponema sp. HNW TaxID=3116654 RepID=UPI003D0F65DF